MNKELTKEECLKTLEDSRFLEVVIRGENGNFEYYSNFEDTVTFDLLKQLINEHFDNPPLKFEELEENNWYWDNKDKEWCKYISYQTFEYLDGYGSEFEENRFYRYEVKE